MDYNRFAKQDLVAMLEIIQSSVACDTEDGVKGLMDRTRCLVSADYSVSGFGDWHNGCLSLIKNVINLNYPVEWMKIYNQLKLYEKDPIIWRQAAEGGVHLWTETYRLFGEKTSKDFIVRASDFGIKHGVSGGITSATDGTMSIMTFSGPKKRFTQYHRAILSILLPHVNQALTRVCMSAVRERNFRLTAKEREILKWMKDGKTNWEISSILNISERTAKFHAHNIEHKLNAVNRPHAVAIAYELGFVH
ncbi:MAG: autoinducer binding domain-containing protein [Deltaproteobacteria bacterium]|nr:autoinducer binding domain-containing protein [Deltaproteobacteria bacterium]